MALNHKLLSSGLLALLVTPAFAQLPYNPARVIPVSGAPAAYVFRPQSSSSQFSLSLLDTSQSLGTTTTPQLLLDGLPFLEDDASKSFITLPDREGITVLAGDCQENSTGLELWRFTRNDKDNNGTWNSLPVSAGDSSLGAKYLSASFTFSQTTALEDAKLYVFGGMCPNGTSNESNWASQATYSNTMLTIGSTSPAANSQYQISLTGSRAPPIPEAGLTITPLSPTFSNTSEGNVSQQQNFILLGGHTQAAFINMSQLAIFSLPQSSWAFVGVTQPSDPNSVVEPRSGHTAVLTPDGSKIIVLGGWVGDVSTPAQPQLAILELGQGFGGQGDWTWTIPSVRDTPFASGQGVYGHGAAMLSGDVMVVTGGYPIASSASRVKRAASSDLLFFNTTAMSWTSSYENPDPSGTATSSQDAQSTSSGLKASEKAGLGAGLGLGIAAAIGVAVVWLLYSRKLREKRVLREKEIRELALGAERLHTPMPPPEGDDRYPSMRTASWNGAQEQQIEGSGNPWPWAPASQSARDQGSQGDYSNRFHHNNSALDVADPSRGVQSNISHRGPLGGSSYPQLILPGVPGGVFRIDEEDEGSQAGSMRRTASQTRTLDRRSVASDPFKDPPNGSDSSQSDPAAQQRQKEVDGWVEDWQSAAETMSVSRTTSQAHSRTYSNLSQFRAAGPSSSGRGSPEKSDRTGSNLSDKSLPSISEYSRSGQTTGTLTRDPSQRSASTGYALFAGAAAAMGRMTGSRPGVSNSDVDSRVARAPSNRSVSFNVETLSRDRDDTFASSRSPWGAPKPGESQMVYNRHGQRPGQAERGYYPLNTGGSPSKDKYSGAGSLSGSGRRAMNLLGSVKRVFTGTGSVDVQDRIGNLEQVSGHSSPTKHSGLPEMMETHPRRSLSTGASFWRGQQGPKDWGSSNGEASTSSRGKEVPGVVLNDNHGELGDDDGDWDVETAVQQRVVQVMFTVPKEKLRVVNADALSLLSSNRSEVDHDEDRERDQMKRMSSVREGDEDHDVDEFTATEKGKGRAT
ncbi:hypothetical protein PV10_08279 [Exophiala mesophila]|uniref:Uncharacterized protein n=1 Tax=Exophiala mesophila TaxID=212818 RepID=A0A0D1Z1H0_EXOME|nr:uncharacterized protein PV10_08279 [Exophiala mesophila]KIV88612.1 hypothetical protein PV10_08279 [Exophiala mesophila]